VATANDATPNKRVAIQEMRRIRPRDSPPLPWVDPSVCIHPKPVALLKFRDFDETLYRCMACGETMTRNDLQGKEKGSNSVSHTKLPDDDEKAANSTQKASPPPMKPAAQATKNMERSTPAPEMQVLEAQQKPPCMLHVDTSRAVDC